MKVRCKSFSGLSFLLLVAALLVWQNMASAGDDGIPEILVSAPAGVSTASESLVAIAIPGTVESVAIDFATLRSPGPNVPVGFSSPNGEFSILARRAALEKSLDGTLTWHGDPVDAEGSIVISFYKNTAFGRLEIADRVFKIEPDSSSGLHWLYELNPEFEAECGDCYLTPPEELPADAAPVPSGKKKMVTVDLLVLYTNGFAAQYPGSKLNAQINFLIGVTNESLRSSKIYMKVRVVGKKMVNFRDGGDLSDPLNAMTLGQGSPNDVKAFKGVINLRNKLGADQVTLLRVYKGSASNKSTCGRAWVMTVLSTAFAQWGFSVVQVGRFYLPGGVYTYCTDQTTAHELGHNWGSHHNIGDRGVFNYSVGHRFGGGLYRTVMSYKSSGGSEMRVNHFSNPKIKHQGFATGLKQANNAKSINNTKATIARWRTSNDKKPPRNKTRGEFINGSAASTANRNVKLKIIGKDNVALAAYHVTESGKVPKADGPGWVDVPVEKKFKQTVDYTLSSGKGKKTVTVRFKDLAGNISKPKTDKIKLN